MAEEMAAMPVPEEEQEGVMRIGRRCYVGNLGTSRLFALRGPLCGALWHCGQPCPMRPSCARRAPLVDRRSVPHLLTAIHPLPPCSLEDELAGSQGGARCV